MKKFRILYLLPLLIILQSCEDKKGKNFNEKSLEANRGLENERAQSLNSKTQVDAQALGFIKVANESGLTEVKASALAQSISKNPRVVAFAKMMVSHHTMLNKELAQLALDKHVTRADTISRQHQKTIDSISKLPKNNFDKAYMNMMVKDHVDAVNLFEKTTSNRYNAVQDLAKKTLPKLKMHLDSARAIAASLK
jgi:putative membrane protein